MFQIRLSRILSKTIGLYSRGKLTRVGYSAVHRRDSNNDPVDVIKSYDRTWLRENCRCPECYSHVTSQRKLALFDLRPEQKTVSHVNMAPSGDKIVVNWQDGHVSEYDPEWLSKTSYPGERDAVERQLWDGATIRSRNLEPVPAEEVTNQEEGLKKVIQNLLVYGFALVNGVEPTVESTKAVAERVSLIQETFYGLMWELSADLKLDDVAYTDGSLLAHTDTAYLYQPGSIQVFQCLQHDGTGGETFLVDGFHAAESLRQEDPEAFRLLCKHPIIHEFREKNVGNKYHFKSLAPVLVTNPVSGELVSIRYNHYDRSPISTIQQSEMADYYRALGALVQNFSSPDAEFRMKLRPGTLLFVDNWRVLHGRTAFTGFRHICGCYLSPDEWKSKARMWGMIV